MSPNPIEDEVLLPTLELLEWRLRRLQFVIYGDSRPEEHGGSSAQPAVGRLAKLENALNVLTHQYQAIYEILKLHKNYPLLLTDTPSNTSTSQLEPAQKLVTVLTEAPSFQATASQLTSLKDHPLPPLRSFTQLVALEPRIALVEEQQIKQAREIAELRQRSGLLLLRWHEIFVLGQGRCWAEWDSRMRKAERSVRRQEIRNSENI